MALRGLTRPASYGRPLGIAKVGLAEFARAPRAVGQEGQGDGCALSIHGPGSVVEVAPASLGVPAAGAVAVVRGTPMVVGASRADHRPAMATMMAETRVAEKSRTAIQGSNHRTLT